MALSDSLLNKTAKVYTKSAGTVDSFGETAFSLSASINELSVAIQPVKEQLEFTTGGKTYVVRNVAYCNYREDISTGDYLEVDGEKYLIASVENDGGRNHHLRMYVTKA
jgi:hypothetical protein